MMVMERSDCDRTRSVGCDKDVITLLLLLEVGGSL